MSSYYTDDDTAVMASAIGPNIRDSNPTGDAEIDARRMVLIRKLERQLTPNEAFGCVPDPAEFAAVEPESPVVAAASFRDEDGDLLTPEESLSAQALALLGSS
jgi:hypothetical protein